MSQAEAMDPGDAIRAMLGARDWTQAQLAEIIGRSPRDVSDLVSGKRAISPDIAKELAAALETPAQYWIELDGKYRLTQIADVDDAITRRARLHAFAPIKDMIKRHWLKPSDDAGVLEESVKRYYGIRSLDEPLNLPHAARRVNQEVSPAQWAWLFRARHLATAVQAAPFSRRSLSRGLTELRSLLLSAQETRRVARVLADAGIRLLVIEQLPKTTIDGACFWIDRKSPVIALSLRYDRIDCFWFTLAHELGHVASGDALSIDAELAGESARPAEDDAETEANRFAADLLIPQESLDDFIARTRPLYGRQKILGFAARLRVHPGIVVGQLQFRQEIPWSAMRPMLEKVRDNVTQSTLTDGWGQVPPPVE